MRVRLQLLLIAFRRIVHSRASLVLPLLVGRLMSQGFLYTSCSACCLLSVLGSWWVAQWPPINRWLGQWGLACQTAAQVHALCIDMCFVPPRIVKKSAMPCRCKQVQPGSQSLLSTLLPKPRQSHNGSAERQNAADHQQWHNMELRHECNSLNANAQPNGCSNKPSLM